ncbi:MAG: glycoside hydrolase family 26 protein [Humibacillus sp.]|nr:glycoside hydrolase family 26 protein [Humibacillus sp.]MDN5778916.1 glycoside hydrolase family 26 protein [Humibacillus sp.]
MFEPRHREPVNPAATAEARDLLARIQATAGTHVLSGQHNTPRERSAYSDQAAELTGHYPAVWGQDFGFAADGDMDGVSFRQAVIDEAIEQHRAGSIVTLMWHAVRPTENEPVTFDGSICAGPLPQADWDDLLTEGTATHARWVAQVDTIAAFLIQLREARVPVLWRPYHEMNGSWFWWGGRDGDAGYTALYRQLHERLVTGHRLDNLLWVWNANAPRADAAAYAGFYPGHDVVDVLAADVYANDYRQSHHDELVALADGRPVALGEVGVLPTPQTLEQQRQWAWFMTWTDLLTRENDPAHVRRLFDSHRVRHRIFLG